MPKNRLRRHTGYTIIHRMQLTFVQLPRFAARWAQLKLNDDDLRALEQTLLRNPVAGAVVAGTGGLRKVRFAAPSRHTGKRGAFRVGYAYFRVADTIYLLAIYPKNDQANLTGAEKAEARKLIDFISRGLQWLEVHQCHDKSNVDMSAGAQRMTSCMHFARLLKPSRIGSRWSSVSPFARCVFLRRGFIHLTG